MPAIVLQGAGIAFSASHDLNEMVDRDLPFYQRLFDSCEVAHRRAASLRYLLTPHGERDQSPGE